MKLTAASFFLKIFNLNVPGRSRSHLRIPKTLITFLFYHMISAKIIAKNSVPGYCVTLRYKQSDLQLPGS